MMTMEAHQRQFDLRIPSGVPLFCINTARALLNRSEDDILHLIECGRLRWAFDLRGAGADRAEWRIWQRCLVAYAHQLDQPGAEVAEVLDAILPKPVRDSISRRWLADNFNCSSSHIGNLAEAGLLERVEGAGRERASGGIVGQQITRASVEAFLKTRLGEGAGR